MSCGTHLCIAVQCEESAESHVVERNYSIRPINYVSPSDRIWVTLFNLYLANVENRVSA
jgi:hypothetical protein